MDTMISDTLTVRAAAYWLTGITLGVVVVLIVRRIRT